MSKLTEAQAYEIRAAYCNPRVTMRMLADKYGVALISIYAVVHGLAHKDPRYVPPENLLVERNGVRKLSDSQVAEIRKRYASEDTTQEEIARDYGVSQRLISYLVHNQRRTETTE